MKHKKIFFSIFSLLLISNISYADKYALEYVELKGDYSLTEIYETNYMENAKQKLETLGIFSKKRQDIVDKYSDFLKHYEENYKNLDINERVNFINEDHMIDNYNYKNISAVSNKILTEEEIDKINGEYRRNFDRARNPKSLNEFNADLDYFYNSYEKVIEYGKENKKLLSELDDKVKNEYENTVKSENFGYTNYLNTTSYKIEKFIEKLPEKEANKIKKIIANNREIWGLLVQLQASGNYGFKKFVDVDNMPEKEGIDELFKYLINHNLTLGVKNKNFGENTSIVGVGNIVEKSGSNVYGDRNKLISNTDTKLVGSDNTIYGEKNIVLGSKNNIGEEAKISSGNIVIGNEVEIKGINNAIVLGNKSKAVENAISVGSENNKRKITFVKDGEISSTSSDAINGSQLYKFKQEMNRSTGGKIANALSIAAIPQVNGNKKFSFGVGTGYSGSDISIAFGFSGQTDSKNVVYKLSGAVNTSNEIALSCGVNYSFSEMESKEYSGIKFIINEFNKDEVKLNDKLIRKLNGIIEFITDNNIKNIEIYSSDNEYNTIMRINEIKKYIKNKNVKIKVSMKILENISKTENIIINILR